MLPATRPIFIIFEHIMEKQINDIIPNTPIFLEKIDDLIIDLKEKGIESIDESMKKISKKTVKLKEKKERKQKIAAFTMTRFECI